MPIYLLFLFSLLVKRTNVNACKKKNIYNYLFFGCVFLLLLFEWFTLYIYMFRLTIIGSINTCVPNLSLSLSLVSKHGA